MIKSNIHAVLKSDIRKVWGIVTDLYDYKWRDDIIKIEVMEGEKQFSEYTQDGFKTDFNITVFEQLRRYEFDIENKNIKGHWTGVFQCTQSGTVVDFTEEIKVKNFFMKPFVGRYLKKQQEKYVENLKKALGE